MSAEPPKKKQKVVKNVFALRNSCFKVKNNNQPITTYKISNGSFASLFLFDWFLIELGRKLINNRNENDLINILCLCREINEKATVIFRQHFLNFDLQMEIFKLAKARKLDQIHQIFQTKGLSLNPSFDCTYFQFKQKGSSKKPQMCVHDDTVKKYFPNRLRACECTLEEPEIPLVVLATRFVGMDSLVKLLLFHPRRALVSDFNIREILNWACVHGHLDVVELYLRYVKFDSLETPIHVDDEEDRGEENSNKIQQNNIQDDDELCLMEHNFDLDFMEVACIIYGRLEILKKLAPLRAHLRNGPGFSEFFSEFDFISYFELCFKYQGSESLKYLKALTGHFDINSFKELMSEGIKHGAELVIVLMSQVLNVFKLSPYKKIEFPILLDEDHLVAQDAINLFLESTGRGEPQSDQCAILFSIGFGLEKPFKALFMEREWSDQQLMDLLRNPIRIKHTKNHDNIFKQIWSSFSPTFQFPEEDFEFLLGYLLAIRNEELFKLVWNDKRVVRTKQWTNDFVFEFIGHLNVAWLKFLVPQCDLSAPKCWFESLEILRKKSKLGMKRANTKREFRIACLLRYFRKFFEIIKTDEEQADIFETLQKLLEIKWSTELIETILKLGKVVDIWVPGNFGSLLSRSKSIDPSLWKKETLEFVYITIAGSLQHHRLSEFLNRFSSMGIDLNVQNNEAFRNPILLSHHISYLTPILETFKSSSFRFRNEKERKEMYKMARQRHPKADLKVITSIEVMENQDFGQEKEEKEEEEKEMNDEPKSRKSTTTIKKQATKGKEKKRAKK